MNVKTIIAASDENELKDILETIYVHNRALLSEWVSKHLDLLPAPVKPDPPKVEQKIDDKEFEALQKLCKETIEVLEKGNGEVGAHLEMVFDNVIGLGHERALVEDAVEMLLDKGIIYEPGTGMVKVI